jgi:carboxypeptidase Taq
MSEAPKQLTELKNHLRELSDLGSAQAVLAWDMETYMPPGGAPARGRALSTLSKIGHQKFTSAEIGRLLDELRSYEESLPHDHDDAALIRLTRRDYERQTRLPSEFVAQLAEQSAASYDAWTKARPANDYASVLPHLQKNLDNSRRYAEYFPGYEHIADPLIDGSDFGMKASTIRQIFAQLREQLVPLVNTVTALDPVDSAALNRTYTPEQITAFATDVIKRFGYDFERGRLDRTHHPFCTTFSIGDVRITTRYPEHDWSDPLFSTLHESGHAMYEQGIDAAYEGTPLAGGTSAGVHESQSRLWENIVGRSRGFWEYFYPLLQQHMPEQTAGLSLDEFHRIVNRVERSLIRTEADELTYNLHVMLRFEFEMQLLEGTLDLKDLPEAWHARYQADLGVHAPDDRDGVLQDVHWYGGRIGGVFQGYTLGNILSAHFYELALAAHPQIPAEMKSGKFDLLHGWLRENIYRHGSKFTAPELIERITGGGLTIEPYMRYLRTKYSELYAVQFA